MTDSEYLSHAEQLLSDIERCCDLLNDMQGVDIDNQRVGSMVTLVFPNQSQIIVNLQRPLHEVWLAAQAGGFHFKFDNGRWMDSKGSGEFFESLSRWASEQLGRPVQFRGASVSG